MKAYVLAGCCFGLSSALSVSAAPPPDFTFTQPGYTNGVLSGFFSGVDSNGDGFLSTPEVSDFQFAFLGTDGSSFQSLAVPVNEMFEGGGGFGFKLGGTLLGDDPGEFIAAGVTGVRTAGFSYFASSTGGTFSSPDGFPLGTTSTTELVRIVPIPEPASYALLLGGLVALSWRVVRRTRKENWARGNLAALQ